MDCAELHDIFENFENRVANDIRKEILPSDFFINNIKRKPWLDNQGRTFSYRTYDRSGLAGAFLPFTPIASYPDSTCQIPTTEVPNFASTLRTVTLFEHATNTTNFCLRDLEFDHQITEQLLISVKNMGDATRFNWSQELMNKYVDLSGKKTVYTPDVPTSETVYDGSTPDANRGWLAVAPTSPLDWAILDYVYNEQSYIATPADYAGTDEEGKVVLVVVGGYDTFNQLKNQDSNFRGDLLAVTSGGVNEQRTLIGSPGMPKKVYRGWKFETIRFDARYDLVNGTWVQRFPYEAMQASHGTKLEVSQLYKDANYTDVIVFSQGVFDHLVPKAPSSKAGYEWNADVDWTGQHKWRKLPIEKGCNDDGSLGYWRSTYAYGPQLQRPDLGWVIRVQRCKPEFGQFACSVPGSI